MKSEQFQLHAAIEAEHWWFTGRRAILVRVIEQLVPASREVIIADVGCGTGGNISALAGKYSCLGMDTSEEAIDLARARFPHVTFICGQAPGCLGTMRDSVDIFLLLDVLEHVEFDRDLLLQLFAVLKPGGHIVLTVPAKMSLWSPHDENYGHYRRYEPEQLEALWSDLPVTVRLFSFFNTYLYPLVKGVRAVTRLSGGTWGDAGTDLSVPLRPLNRMLESIYSYEANALTKMLSSERKRGFPFGASLIACLRKDAKSKCTKS